MRRLLIEAQGKFRKMMSDNKALASRIDQDIQSAQLEVSALRAELADTNQKIRDICSTPSMAGNVITTCMPPTATTNTAVSSTADGHWLKEAKPGPPVTRAESAAATSSCLPPSSPIADKGGTTTSPNGSTRSPPGYSTKHGTQGSKFADHNSSMVNGPKDDGADTKEQNNLLINLSPPSKLFDEDNPETKPPRQIGSSSGEFREISFSSHQAKEFKDKMDSLTESSEASEEMSVSKHKSHRRERRSLKGSDVQKSLLNDLMSQHDSFSADDPKSELQRSESDGNQNSAPECDLSISGSPFKEETAKTTPEKSASTQKNKEFSSEGAKTEDMPSDLHRNSPPVKDVSNAQCFSFPKDSNISSSKELNVCHRYKAKTKSDPLDKRRDKCTPEYSVLSSPSSVMRQKARTSNIPLAVCSWDDRTFDKQGHAGSWCKSHRDTSSGVNGRSLLDDSLSKGEGASENQEGLPSDFCDRKPTKESRYVVFDSKDSRRPYREWRSSVGESRRDQQSSDDWKNKSCDIKELNSVMKMDEKRQAPEKDIQSSASTAQDNSYSRKSINLDYSKYNSTCTRSQDEGPKSVSELSSEVEALKIKNSALLRDLEEVMESRDEKAKENAAMAARLELVEKELKHAKEALAALNKDRKRLKAEKFDLLTQMKQLYSTLEDKEEELREFIRNYKEKMKENEENLKTLTAEREALEQEKWNILKRARDEAERTVLLCTQIGIKDAHIKELQDELSMMQDKQQQIACNPDVLQTTNGFGSPGSVSFRTANGIDSHGTPTPTPGSTSPSYVGTPTQYPESTSPHKDSMLQSLSPDHRPSLLSRSAEDLFDSTELASIKKKTAKEKKGTWGSISRVFSRNKRRKPLDPDLFDGQRASWPVRESGASPLSGEGYAQKLQMLEEARGLPMQNWKAATVLAWLEITMDMPQYGAMCAENVKSGKVLLELSESELEEGLGITNVMHRRKLRLAIEEHRQPSLCRYPKICQMTHAWVVEEWLPSIALTCYLPSFSEHLVDGRVLDTLTKKDLEKHFGITRKFHQLSIMHAIQLLRMLKFDRQHLNQRRLNSENMDVDPLVWTNQRLIKWAASIDLGEYADNLRNTGVHGALAVLEPTFTADTIATALGIPTSKNIIRRHLTTEWQNLIQPARLSLESESVVAKKSKSEKRLASGSSSTSLASQGRSSSLMPSYARRTLDRYDRRRSSWRFSTWRSSQESLKSTSSKKTQPTPPIAAERPHVLPLSPKRHRRTFSSHSDVETLTVTPV